MRRSRRLAVGVVALGVVATACGGAERPRARDAAANPVASATAGRPGADTAPGTPRTPAVRTPGDARTPGPRGTPAPRASASPGVPATAGRGAGSSVTLLYQRGGALYRLRLGDAGARPVRLFAVAGAARTDLAGRYVAVTGRDGVTIRAVADGRVVASVPKGDAAAFGNGTAVVAVRPVAPRFPHDCHRPTHLVEVDLRTGARRTLAELADQFVPAFVAAGTVVGSTVPSVDCETDAAAALDVPSGRLRAFGGGALQAVSPDGRRLWLHDEPDDRHPHGSGRVVALDGRTLARVPYYGVAAFGPGGRIAYTEVVFPEGSSFSSRTTLRVGRDLPAAGDRATSALPEVGAPLWSADGSAVVVRAAVYDDPDLSWRAFVCTSRLDCRPTGLTWFDDVTFLAATAG